MNKKEWNKWYRGFVKLASKPEVLGYLAQTERMTFDEAMEKMQDGEEGEKFVKWALNLAGLK